VYRNSTQVVASGDAISFNTENYDTDAIWAIGNPTMLICKTSGKYIIQGGVNFQNNLNNDQRIVIRLNGTTEIFRSITRDDTMSLIPSAMQAQTVWDMQVNDFVELLVYTSAVTLTTQAGLEKTWFGMTRQADSGPVGPTGGTGATGPQGGNTVIPTVTVAGTNIDWSLGETYEKTLAGNVVLTFSNVVQKPITFAIINTGAFTVTWPGTVKWPGGFIPIQTVGATKKDVYTFIEIGTNIYGVVQQDMQ